MERQTATWVQMIRWAGVAMAVAAFGMSASAARPDGAWPFFCKAELKPDRDGAVYGCGDVAKVSVRVTTREGELAREGKAIVKFTLDGGEKLLSVVTNDLAKANPFVVTGTLDKPGFLMVRVYEPNVPSRKALVNLAFSPEGIRQAVPEPEDFDAFWSARLAEQRKIKDPVTLKRLDGKGMPTGYSYYQLVAKTATADGKVYGFLTVPEGRGPFPLLAIVQAYGPGYDSPDPNFQRPDLITLSLNVHPWDPLDPGYNDFYKNLGKTQPGMVYTARGQESREKFWMLNAILGCKTAIDYARSRPDCDGRLFCTGASQGGGMGLIMAGLTPETTALAVMVPALCDFGGTEVGRRAGWPYPVRYADEASLPHAESVRRFGYFDAANFARRVKAPTVVMIGFIDECCPASSVYAAFNNVPKSVPKSIYNCIFMGHAVDWEALDGAWQWVQGFLPEEHRVHRAYFKW